MTRLVDPSKATNYLKKARDSLGMARIALNEKAYDNAVMSSVHGAINALDALATKYLGKRASGVHTDSLLLVKGLLTAVEYREGDKQFTSLVSMKNASEYEPVLMSKQDAERAIKSSERIVNKVRERLEKNT